MAHLLLENLANKKLYANYIRKLKTYKATEKVPVIPDRNWILASCLPQKPIRILDIGPCRMVFEFLLDTTVVAQYEYHTLDRQPRKLCPEWIVQHVHDCEQSGYPFESNYFDLIICCDVIEHIRNHAVLLNECRRILKVDGQIFLTTPNYSSLPYIRNMLAGKMYHCPDGNSLEQYCFQEHVRYFTTKDLLRYVQSFKLYPSATILPGLVLEVDHKGFFTRAVVKYLYNPLFCRSLQFGHQSIIVLEHRPSQTIKRYRVY